MKPAVLHAGARAELQSAVAYYDSQLAGLGADFRREFEASARSICGHPQMYAVEYEPDVRYCPLRRFPYNIVYVDHGDRIWIAAVAHQKRQPGYWAYRRPT